MPTPAGNWIIVEFFAGILPLSAVAADLGLAVPHVYTSEVDPDAILVANALDPHHINLGDISKITSLNVIDLLNKHPAHNFIVGAGPPRGNVSLANAAASGAMGPKSILREEFARLIQPFFNSWQT